MLRFRVAHFVSDFLSQQLEALAWNVVWSVFMNIWISPKLSRHCCLGAAPNYLGMTAWPQCQPKAAVTGHGRSPCSRPRNMGGALGELQRNAHMARVPILFTNISAVLPGCSAKLSRHCCLGAAPNYLGIAAWAQRQTSLASPPASKEIDPNKQVCVGGGRGGRRKVASERAKVKVVKGKGRRRGAGLCRKKFSCSLYCSDAVYF